MVFGSNVSPGEFDIVARARASLATSLSESIFAGEREVSPFDIESLITMPEEPGLDVSFVQASADSAHRGVRDDAGGLRPTPNVCLFGGMFCGCAVSLLFVVRHFPSFSSIAPSLLFINH